MEKQTKKVSKKNEETKEKKVKNIKKKEEVLESIEDKENNKKEEKVSEVISDKEEKKKDTKKTSKKNKKKKDKGFILFRPFKALARGIVFIFKSIFTFLNNVRKEMKKVVWPNKRNMVKYSIATIIFVLFFSLYFYGVEVLMAWLKSIIVIL